MSKLTKAAADPGKTNLATQGFKVWAFAAYEDALNGVTLGAVYDNMNPVEFTYSLSNGNCTTKNGGVYYWPGKDRALDFFAMSTGKTVTAAFDGQGQSSLARKMTVTGYTVTPTTTDDDFMVAQFVRTSQNMGEGTDSKGRVDLKFHHVLSKVLFNVFTTPIEGTTVTINSLKVEGLTTGGTLTVTDKAGSTPNTQTGVNEVDFRWDLGTETAAFEKVAGTVLTAESAPYATWLVLPQSIETLNVKVNYSIKTGNEDAKTYDHAFALSNSSVKNWGRNQVTTYNINISPNVIKFSADVNEWENNGNVDHNN